MVPCELIPYWKLRSSLTIYDHILLFNERIVIPAAMQSDVMKTLHEGHQGVERCRMRARASVWWPGVNKQVAEMVQNCSQCAKVARQRKEPLITTPLPDYPWKEIGTDMFELERKHYLLVVDYFSRYPEVIQMKTTTSVAIIDALKSIFSRYGIPEVIRSDNGPQFASLEFSKFTSFMGFGMSLVAHCILRAMDKPNGLYRQSNASSSKARTHIWL